MRLPPGEPAYAAFHRSFSGNRSSHIAIPILIRNMPSLKTFWLYATSPISVLTFISDRLYLAAYVHPPTAETLFPYPESPVVSRKRSQRTVDATSAASNRPAPCYFTVDDTLLYNAFHHDFGPLHIGHLYRFAIQFHDILGAKENKDRPIVFWSAADPRSKTPAMNPCLSVRP